MIVSVLGAQIDDGLLTTLAGVGVTATIALMAWVVRELYRISSLLSKVEERTVDHERRLEDLEDGPRRGPGRAVA